MREIPLKHGGVVTVDDRDYEALIALGPWRLSKEGYAVQGQGSAQPMHTVVMQLAGRKLGPTTDHKNLNKLDNTRRNLRAATHRQNKVNSGPPKTNTSGYRGVSLLKKTGRWRVSIRNEFGKSIYLGTFEDKIEAAKAWNHASRLINGEFGYQNPIPEEVGGVLPPS